MIASCYKCVFGSHTSLLQRPVCLECINTYFSYQEKKKKPSFFSSTLGFSVNWRKIGWMSAVSLGQSGECDHKCPWIAPSGNLWLFYFCPRDLYLTVLCHTLCLLVLTFPTSEKTFEFSMIAHLKIHYFLHEKLLANSYTGVGSSNNHN